MTAEVNDEPRFRPLALASQLVRRRRIVDLTRNPRVHHQNLALGADVEGDAPDADADIVVPLLVAE